MKEGKLAGKNPRGGFSSFAHIKKPKFESRSSHTRLHLPKDIVFEIILRLPAKSVSRFKCVSTAWLSIATDPSFIFAHARCAQKSFIASSISICPNNQPFNQLFSFNTCDFSRHSQILYPTFDLASSSCDGLILFLRKEASHPPSSKDYFVMNPLTQEHIDLPESNISKRTVSSMDLYYHRWTGEYRLINFRRWVGSNVFDLDAEVLSLGGTNSSWRQIKTKIPVVSFFYFNSQIQMNDHLYWVYQKFLKTPPSILVFDILKETFSFMELPSYSQKSNFPSFVLAISLKYGLVDMEGILCFWIVYRDKNCIENVMIDIWEAVEDNEKWKNTYSLCLADECPWALMYPYTGHILADCCLCIKERELMFLFTDPRRHYAMGKYEQHVHYLFYWNLKSGKYQTIHLFSGFAMLKFPTLIYRETLISPLPLSHANLTLTGSPI